MPSFLWPIRPLYGQALSMRYHFPEIYLPTFNRSGTYLAAGIFSVLDIFFYFHSIENTYDVINGQLFVDPHGGYGGLLELPGVKEKQGQRLADITLGINMGHVIQNACFAEKTIIIARDPRDIMISSYNSAYFKNETGYKCSIYDALNMPFTAQGGALLGLGCVEEVVIYEQFLKKRIDSYNLLVIYFDEIKYDGVKTVRRMLDFIGVHRSEEQIIRAVALNVEVNKVALKYTPLNRDTGRIAIWKNMEYPAVVDRYNMLASVLNVTEQHEFQDIRMPFPSWPTGAYAEATEHHVRKIVEQLERKYPHGPVTRFTPSLFRLSLLLDELPLLQIYYCFHLLINGTRYQNFAWMVLDRYNDHSSPFLRFAAAVVCNNVDPTNATHVDRISKSFAEGVLQFETSSEFQKVSNIGSRYFEFMANLSLFK